MQLFHLVQLVLYMEQEIEAVLPQLVQTRENGYKAVKYDKLVALLIEGIKEQQTQIEDLKNKIDKLENRK